VRLTSTVFPDRVNYPCLWIALWKCDLPRTSPSTPEPVRRVNKLFLHTTIKLYFVLPFTLASLFYLYWHYNSSFHLRFGSPLCNEASAHFTHDPINLTCEGQVFFYPGNISLLCFRTLLLSLRSLVSHISHRHYFSCTTYRQRDELNHFGHLGLCRGSTSTFIEAPILNAVAGQSPLTFSYIMLMAI
jgi:hypothetical protein